MSPQRWRFLQRTYRLLGASLSVLVLVEVVLFESGAAQIIVGFCRQFHWGLVLGALILLGWMFRRVGYRRRSRRAQYAALAGYVGVKSVLLVPLLARAERTAPGLIETAAVATVAGFVVLSAIVWLTRKDFSFLRAVLRWGGLVALALILSSFVFHMKLGVSFSIGMIGLAGASILYDTSKILRRHSTKHHVAAALRLFSSTVMMFWYVLRLLTRARRSSYG